MITVRTSPAYVNRVRQDWTANGGVYGDGGIYAIVPSNDPFAQLGPTLDLTFAGDPTDLLTASTTAGYTLDASFTTPEYQVAAQYVVWDNGLTQKNFADIVTFTRASTATFVGSNGLIQSAAIDVPRFDYDPVTLAAKGLLIEESRTNLATYSEEFDNAAWSKQNSTVTANTFTSPDGTTTADTIVENAGAGAKRAWQAATISAGATLTLSVYAKEVSGSAKRYLNISVTDNVLSTNEYSYARFDLSAGTVTASGTSGASVYFAASPVTSITAAGNGWYRCTITVVSNTITTVRANIGLTNATTGVTGSAGGFLAYTGDGTSGAYVWGAQLEAGAFPTSYIPTTTASVTRAADSAQVNTLSPWFNATEGTLYVEGATGYISGNSYGAAFQIADGTINNRVTLSIRSTQQGRVIVAGTVEAFQTAGTVTTNTFVKEAYAYKQNDTQLAVGGTSSAVDTSVNIPSGLTTAYIGVSPSGTGPVNGWIKRITYYPRRLSQTELQTITT